MSDNYLRIEQGYVEDWAKYIDYSHMTIDEALDYIRHTNNQTGIDILGYIPVSEFDAHNTN